MKINYQKYFSLYDTNRNTFNATLSSKIKLRSYNSITEIDKKLWDGLANNIFNSWDFLLSLEKARVENSRMKYLIYSDNSTPVAIAVLSIFSISLDLLSGKFITKICDILRIVFPGFMKVKFLFCGTPISIGKNNLRIPDESKKNQILDLLVNGMEVMARDYEIQILCFKEFNSLECESLTLLTEKKFIKASSIPYVYLHINKDWNSFDDYLKSMRFTFRRQINKSLNKLMINNSALSSVELMSKNDVPKIEVIVPKIIDAPTFYEQYIEVMKRAKNKMEILNKDFFENVFEHLKSNCKLIQLIYNKDVLGSAIIFQKSDVMTFVLVGLNYSRNKEYDVYFNIVYRIIALAIENKCRVLEMGQTSYYFKQRCGGNCEEMFFYIKAQNKIFNYLLSVFKPLLFPTIKLNELHVFHDNSMTTIP